MGCTFIENDIATLDPSGTTNRRTRILDAAARAFAQYGFRGSSLRDIARDAGCSLTLLDHHFGGKASLLAAVIKGQHENCHRRLAGLKVVLASTSVFVFADFVTVWANYEFDLHETREGRQYLSLMLRLSADSDVDQDTRRTVNCSESLVVQGFARAHPALDEAALRGGWFMASGALYAAIVGGDEMAGMVPSTSTAGVRSKAIAFVAEGLRAYWTDVPVAEPETVLDAS